MINELNENKSFRSIDNSEVVSLKKKSEREFDLSSNNAPKKKRKKKEDTKDENEKEKESKKDEKESKKSEKGEEKKESNNKDSQTVLPSFNNEEEKKNDEEGEEKNKNSTSNQRPYNKDMSIIPSDIKDFQQKTECTYYQYGNYPVYQKVYFCDNCDTNSIEKICENCYFICHESCGNNFEKDEEGESSGIPNNLFINYDEEENLKFMHGKYLTFICSCGLKRHKLKQVNDETGTLQCNFLNLDIKLKNRALYSCKTCGVDTLCFICYVKCHKNCKTKKLLTEDPKINLNKSCGCCFRNNHSNRFILNKFMSFIFYKQNNYDTIPYVLKIQLLNCIYDCDIYQLLYGKINLFISQSLEQNLNYIKIDEVCIETLKRLVFNVVQVKQFFYFHENIKKTIPLQNIIFIIESINKKELLKYSSFISGLMNIMLNVHFQSDFQNMKCLNYRDFLFTSSLQRIITRNKLFSNSIFIQNIKEKYRVNNQFTIPPLCIEHLNLLHKILTQCEEKDVLDYFDQFIIVFEILHFCLARFLTNKNTLIKIIYELEKICLIFHSTTKKIFREGVDIYSEIINIRKIRKITDYISKIIYMIIINFNDLIIEEKLKLYNKEVILHMKEENKKEENTKNAESQLLNDKFIQTLSGHSKKLFKILSSTSIVYNTFILDNKINLKDNDVLDLLDFVNQALEAFTLIDNSFYNLLNQISFSDFYFFEKSMAKIKNIEKIQEKYKFTIEKKKLFGNINDDENTNNINNFLFKDFKDKKIFINNDRDVYQELVSNSDIKNLEKTIILTCFNNKEKIDTIYKLYFHSLIEFNDVDSFLLSILTNFDKFWKEDDKTIDDDILNVNNNIKKKKSNLFAIKKSQNFEENEKYDMVIMDLFINENKSIIKQKKIINYRNKILNILKYPFPNMTDMNPIFENGNLNEELIFNKEREIYLDIIISELMFSNFDCILTSFLIMDPVMNRYNEKTINIIFQFLLFFTLSKQSLIYFLTGCTINNILKILDLFPLQVLKFLSLITEGIYLYNIDCHQHEQIPKLLNQIYNFIKKNINMKEEYNDINNVRKCIIYTMDILYNLSPNIEIENLTSINELIVEELEKLINKEKIINMFPFQGLIKKYETMKNSNTFINENEENEEEYQANTDNIILEDKSYLMKHIKFIFDKRVKENSNKFPSEKSNFIRRKYKLIDYKEKEIYDYMISEENRECSISDADNKLDNSDKMNENKNEINMNNEKRNSIIDDKDIILNEKSGIIEDDEDLKINKVKNLFTDGKDDDDNNNNNEEKNKGNEDINMSSRNKYQKRNKYRNKTLTPKNITLESNVKIENSLDKMKTVEEKQNSSKANSEAKNNLFSSKLLLFNSTSQKSQESKGLRNSSVFKSKILINMFKNEKASVINEESSSDKSSSQVKTNKKKDKGKSNAFFSSKKNLKKKLKKSLISEKSDSDEKKEKLMKIKDNQELFFSLIKLLSNITYFFLKKNDVFNTFLKINDLSFYQLLLKENYISLEERTILLVFIRMVYINDQIDEKNSLVLDKYMNNKEYYDNLSKLREIFDDEIITYLPISIENLKRDYNNSRQVDLIAHLESNNSFNRFDNLRNLKIVIEIIIHEIKNIYYLIYIEENLIVVNEYITQMIFTVKIISDIFITYDICSHLTLWFYELTKEFLAKLNFFISYLKNINNKFVFNNIDISEYEDNNIKKMEQKNFDIYNKEIIYEYILEGFQLIYSQNNFNQKFKLNTFLQNFSEKDEKNFKNFTLNKTDIPFYAFNYDFYDYDKDKDKSNNDQIIESKTGYQNFNKIRKSIFVQSNKDLSNIQNFDEFTLIIYKKYQNFLKIKNNYVDEFNQFFSSTFYESICCSSYETILDCNKIFLNYCVVYLHNLRLLPSDSIVSFLSMLNKLLTFEPIKTQSTLDRIFTLKNKLLNKDISANDRYIYFEETFFRNLALILREKININIATCKHIVIAERYEKINYVTKILIQFFQLLGEGHNKLLHHLIVLGKKDIYDKEKELMLNQENINTSNYNYFNNNIKSEEINIKETNNSINVFQILCQSLNHVIRCFINYQNLIFKGELPYDKLIIMAHNIIDFIIEYFQGTNDTIYKIMYKHVLPIFPNMRKFLFLANDKDEEIDNILKNSVFMKKVISDKKIFVYTMKIKIITLICSLLEEGNANQKNINSLKDILEYFHPTDIYESGVQCFYNLENYLPCLKEINLGDQNSVKKLIHLYKYNEKFQISIELKYFTKIFYYLRLLSDLYEREEVKSFLEGLKKTYKLNSAITKKNEEFKSTALINKDSKEKEPIEKVNYVLYLFVNELLKKIEIRGERGESHDNEINKINKINNNQKTANQDFTFFVIPPICLLLSEQTITYFNTHVDRSSVHSKITNLINETDYFICEMFYHKLYNMNYGTFMQFLAKVNIQIIEVISYLFTVLQNIFLVIHFYSKEEINDNKKLVLYIPNIIIGIIHIIFMVLGLILWFYFMLNLEVIHNYMINYNVKFLFRDNEQAQEQKQSHFAILNEGVEDLSRLMDKLYNKIPLSKKLYTILFDSIIFNNKVNMILLTLLCEILFLSTGNGIFLAIPTLFIANMMSLLRGIFLIFKLRWSQLLLVLTYCYLIVYNFAIIAFYYLTHSFNFDRLYNVNDDTNDNEENMCGSLLQCYFTLLSYGVRSGGGIGDVITMLTFKKNTSSYIARFFFDILFHIIIVLIMTNLIFGIIVDSFAAFRGSTDDSENDKKNICYICQMTRDDAINKNIDFNKHRGDVHDMWNYVYFLTYLHINNSNNFKILETSVWDKLEESDTSWIPIMED